MQVGISAVNQVLWGGAPTNGLQEDASDQMYLMLTDPIVNISIGSDYLGLLINSKGFAAGLNTYTGGNKTENADVTNCENILNPNDPSTYGKAYAAATAPPQ